MENNQFSIHPLNKYVLDVWSMIGTVAAIVSRMDLSSMELILGWRPLRKNQIKHKRASFKWKKSCKEKEPSSIREYSGAHSVNFESQEGFLKKGTVSERQRRRLEWRVGTGGHI